MSASDIGVGSSAASCGLPLDMDRVGRGLTAQRLGKQFSYFAELDSTNSHARRLAEEGAEQGHVVIAESQTRGRGRLGRRWISPPYANLYLSIILRPQLPPALVPQITLMAAVGVAETLQCFLPVRPLIKWPNDILIGGKKLAGILTEVSCNQEHVEFVILGLGVNLNFSQEQMPDEIRESATSVSVAGGIPADREAFLGRLIKDLDRCYGEIEAKGFADLALRWESYFGMRGQRVRFELLDHVAVGIARGIDEDGALIIEDENGNRQRVVAGEVTPVAY